MNYLDTLFGTEGTVDILSVSVEFGFGFPAWLVGFFCVAFCFYSFWIYKREGAKLSKKVRVTLSILRSLVCIIVFLSV